MSASEAGGREGADGSPGSLELTALIVGIIGLLIVGTFLGYYGKRADIARFFDAHISDVAAQWLTAGLVLAAVALTLLSRRGGQLAAMFVTSFREIARGGSLWVALVAGIALAAGAPLLEAEGGAPARVKMIASLTSAVAALVGTLLAVVLPALSFSREMETRSIYVTATKPVPRWIVFAGKLVAVCAALAAAMALLCCGAWIACCAAVRSEAARAAAVGRNPEHVWLTAYYARKDLRPELKHQADGSLPRPAVFYVGKKRDYKLPAGELRSEDKWLVLRVHAGPANPMLQTAPAKVSCGGQSYALNVDRSIPVDLVVPAAAVAEGHLSVSIEPVLDAEGLNRGLRSDPRGTVSIAVRGDGLGASLAKMLGMIWLQLVLVAAMTMTAACALSFPVAVVAGLATAVTGHLSGLAVGILRNALAVGRRAAAGGPGSANEESVSAVGQLVRQEAAGLLSVLPDFEAAATSEFLAAGDHVPWRFVAAGVVALLVFRTVPVVLLGSFVFSRKEVGA